MTITSEDEAFALAWDRVLKQEKGRVRAIVALLPPTKHRWSEWSKAGHTPGQRAMTLNPAAVSMKGRTWSQLSSVSQAINRIAWWPNAVETAHRALWRG